MQILEEQTNLPVLFEVPHFSEITNSTAENYFQDNEEFLNERLNKK